MDGESWLFFLIVALVLPFSQSDTDAQDVAAINRLYVALGSPTLPGWTEAAGDPCGQSWQGVTCTGSNIDSITINAANLGGTLGKNLGDFTSITIINLSNNNIGGSIPDSLPVTLQNFFLADNQLTGSIPSSLSKLTHLTALSLNRNNLDGELPDAFQSLTGLVNLDISQNNFSGQLPPSVADLASLTTLNIQNNQLSGTLNVLEDLPLTNLNVENNSFSGPIPAKLLNIPNFKSGGNPFNTSVAPSSSPPTPTPSPAPPSNSSSDSGSSPSKSPHSSNTPANSSSGHGSSGGSNGQASPSPAKKNNPSYSAIKIIGFVLLSVVLFIVVVLLVIFCLSKYQERKARDEYTKSPVARVYQRPEEPVIREPSGKSWKKDEVSDGRRGRELNLSVPAVPDVSSQNRKDHIINFERSESDIFVMPPPPPPPPRSPAPAPAPPRPPPPPPLEKVEKVIVKPIVPPEQRTNPPEQTVSVSTSATSFSVATLQQYTNSFREENVIRESRLGKVYLAEFPDGKLLEVMKIDNVNSRIEVHDFLELVVKISELRHPNVLQLVGYCAEYGQRLLVYSHFSRKSLHDVLREEEDAQKTFSWNARLQVALGAAKALEYLHESCQPPVVHQNFEPANVLLDNKLGVRVAECGMAELMSSSSVTQLSGRMRALLNYEAPEIQEFGLTTEKSDVYSFGVVMLELLTGRKPYDSSRPRAEQHLVRWASAQLHDIDSLSWMVDPAIKGQCSEKALSRFADIISKCIQRGPDFRPQMSDVVHDLSRIISNAESESD